MNLPGCPDAFTEARLDLFRSALLAAYEEAAATYDPDRGFDAQLHGQIVYHVASNRLERGFEDDPTAQFVSAGRGPELWIDGHCVRWNKVGGNAIESIATAFPRGSAAAAAMARANQQLSLWAGQGLELEPTNWVLAHVGNPRLGLLRLYLAAPIDTDGRSVTGWARWFAIYDAEQPLVDFPTAPAPGLPEEDAYGALQVSLIDEATGEGSTTTLPGRA